MISRLSVKLSALFSQPKAGLRDSENINSYAENFHKHRAKEAVLLALYKKTVASKIVPALLPQEGDMVLLGKKSAQPGTNPIFYGKFALLGGMIEKTDLSKASTSLDVFNNALSRELYEEAGLSRGDYSFSYCSSFHDKKTEVLVHCFAGYLHADPSSTSSANHSHHSNIKPRDGEHESFSWMPVNAAFSSRQVSHVAKRAIDLTLTHGLFR